MDRFAWKPNIRTYGQLVRCKQLYRGTGESEEYGEGWIFSKDFRQKFKTVSLVFVLTQISLTTAAKELSVSDTDVSEVTWTDNGTFNLSEGYTPQTDTSDDLDRPSEEVFSRDLSDFPSLENGTGTNDEDELSLGLPTELRRKKEQLDSGPRPSKERQSAAGLTLPLGSDQTFHLMSNLAGDVITAAVTAAIKDQLGGVQHALSQAAPSLGEDTDTEEGDDFELLDQSELDQIESELGLSQDEEEEAQQNRKSSGFLSNLLGGH
ncbi:hypothetical protein CB1_001692007 [Camelus ferus]|nr:hypothetical protein CB1_001692007 [Camelus ferus]